MRGERGARGVRGVWGVRGARDSRVKIHHKIVAKDPNKVIK